MSIFSRFLSFFYSVKAKIVSKMESENRKFIGVFELLDHLKESENERRKSKILKSFLKKEILLKRKNLKIKVCSFL